MKFEYHVKPTGSDVPNRIRMNGKLSEEKNW